MAVPLFDTATPLAPLRDELRAAVARVLDSEHYILGPEVAAFEQRVRRLLRRRARGRRCQRHRRDHDRAARDGRRPRRRGGRALLHVLRVRRGDPADGRHAGVLRHRPRRPTASTAETVRAALTPRTKAVIVRAPVRQRRPGRRDRGARRAGARGRRAGGRLARAGGPARARSATAATFSFFPSKNLGVLRRRRHDHHLGRRGRRDRAHRCASTARATRSATSGSATTRASTSCRRRSCACSCRTSTRGRMGAGRRRATTSRRGSASSCGSRGRSRDARPRGTSTSSPPARRSACRRRSTRRGVACKPYYRTPVHRQPPMREWGAGAELPGTEQAARTHLAIPMSPVLTRAQADEVVAAARSAA